MMNYSACLFPFWEQSVWERQGLCSFRIWCLVVGTVRLQKPISKNNSSCLLLTKEWVRRDASVSFI